MPTTFFDEYSAFYTTSKTASHPNRLNHRYQALIENNSHAIYNKSILDLGSHDGRWSFAALKNNAKYVLGIEGRIFHIKNAEKNMKQYGAPEEKYSFIIGDVHEEIMKISVGKIDTVFCFGFFYHTLEHMFLLSQIKRIRPKYLILDTSISNHSLPLIELRKEDTEIEGAGLGNKKKILIGWPSKLAVEWMLDFFGFNYSYYNWQDSGITNWEYIEDYKRGERISLIAENKDVNF